MPETTYAKLERLAKWRKFFSSWQLGTRAADEPGLKAVTDQYEKLILLRAEVSALTGLLIRKGVIGQAEFEAALGAEADQLSADYATAYPGWTATDAGLEMHLPEAADTMRRLRFPA